MYVYGGITTASSKDQETRNFNMEFFAFNLGMSISLFLKAIDRLVGIVISGPSALLIFLPCSPPALHRTYSPSLFLWVLLQGNLAIILSSLFSV